MANYLMNIQFFKDETFAIQFSRVRGELYRWKHSNDSLSKEKSLLYF